MDIHNNQKIFAKDFKIFGEKEEDSMIRMSTCRTNLTFKIIYLCGATNSLMNLPKTQTNTNIIVSTILEIRNPD